MRLWTDNDTALRQMGVVDKGVTEIADGADVEKNVEWSEESR